MVSKTFWANTLFFGIPKKKGRFAQKPVGLGLDCHLKLF